VNQWDSALICSSTVSSRRWTSWLSAFSQLQRLNHEQLYSINFEIFYWSFYWFYFCATFWIAQPPPHFPRNLSVCCFYPSNPTAAIERSLFLTFFGLFSLLAFPRDHSSSDLLYCDISTILSNAHCTFDQGFTYCSTQPRKQVASQSLSFFTIKSKKSSVAP